MDIISVYPPYIYSIRYDGQTESEYDRLFENWNNVDYVNQFMLEHKEFLQSYIWNKINEPEEATRQVLNEAEELELFFDELFNNTQEGLKPDFDEHFTYLNGKYAYLLELQPMKSYGTKRPSLLRIYAIKMGQNIYLITDGGIKLADTIQNSPDLKDHVIQNIDRVIAYLKENGILDENDMTTI